MIVFLSGGARSGKSRLAEHHALLAHDESRRRHPSASLIYLATSRPRDGEMRERVRLHQAARAEPWRTEEEPLHIGDALRRRTPGDVVLLDCLTLWLDNALFGSWKLEPQMLPSCVQDWIIAARERHIRLFIVSNELNEGEPIRHEGVQLYLRSLLTLHRLLTREADEVIQVIAGLPLYWKKEGVLLDGAEYA